MVAAIQSALSGIQAFSLKTQATANNIANLNTDGFQRDVVTLSSQSPQGVVAEVNKDQTPGALMVETTAAGEEMVEQSNVDLVREVPELLMDKQGFNAALKTLQVSDQMTETLIDLNA